MARHLKKTSTYLISIVILLCLSESCKKDNEIPANLIISIDEIVGITDAAANVNVTIAATNSSEISKAGICWSRTNNTPTVNDFIKESETTSGNYTIVFDRLNPYDTYYIRAYATNKAGKTAYGDVKTFKTQRGELTDQAGNTYHTITIGNQVWLQENLKTSLFNDGTIIPYVTNSNTWTNTTDPALCVYDNVPANKDRYGFLYNFYAVNTDKLAPQGWHVATDKDWDVLIRFLGGKDVAGGKLKSDTKPADGGTWKEPNTGANNEFGFTALGGGIRAGDFFAEGIETFFIGRSTSGYPVYTLGNNQTSISIAGSDESDGGYIRLIRDTPAND